jgi:hypothetical protein
MVIQQLSKFEHFEELVNEIKDLINQIPFTNQTLQLALQVDNPEITDWYTPCGRILRIGKVINEQDYKYIQPTLRGSFIEKWLESLPVPVFRARLMLVKPKTCYSIHNDPLPRIHLPVITNPHCLMLFPEKNITQHLPADGFSYWVNTKEKHTFMNCSEIDRIHLVAVTNSTI